MAKVGRRLIGTQRASLGRQALTHKKIIRNLKVTAIAELKKYNRTKFIANIRPLGRNTRKRFKHKIRNIKAYFTKATEESRQRLEKGYNEEAGIGDQLDQVKTPGSLQIYMQNPRGLGSGLNMVNTKCAIEDLDHSKVDIIALPETQVN